MISILQRFYDWIWSESIWVPPGYTWDDFTPGKSSWNVPNSADLKTYPFIFAFGFIFLNRFVVLPYIFVPLWLKFAPRDVAFCSKPMDNLYISYTGKPPEEEVNRIAKSLDWNQRKLDRYKRRNSKYWRNLPKFLECSWNIVYYSLYCMFGFYVLADKPWLYNVNKCWVGFPRHDLIPELWWYYMIALGYYYSQMYHENSQATKRKDSLQMQLHHIATIFLMSFSIITNMMRMGALILFVHECADIPLLAGKISGYLGCQKAMDRCFVVFAVLWIVTRLGIFPFVLLRSTMFEAHVQEGIFYPVYYILNGLLLAILIMHCIWTFYILQIAFRQSGSGQVTDVRSSESEQEFEEDEKND